MDRHLLTIIITFLNEGEEIGNTLNSIREHSDENIDILLIDDASNDGFDYREIACKYNAGYTKNQQRSGVAASRDLGVHLCTTPYFLLLDGHMRFYDSHWVKRITEKLQQNDRQLLCCQTKVLARQGNHIIEKNNKAFGAFINFSQEKNILNIHWLIKDTETDKTTIDIPCILGAAYACSKRYWQYLRGLSGLRYYGCDEQYISLKVWLEGGRCRLLKDIGIGHIYRTEAPYPIENSDIIYNKLIILESLFPYSLRRQYITALKKHFSFLFAEAYQRMQDQREYIRELQTYYQQIFTRNTDYILHLNNKPMENSDTIYRTNKPLIEQAIRSCLLNHSEIKNIGLMHGKMGSVLLLAHYARYSSTPFFDDLAGDLMDQIYSECRQTTPIDFENGLCGIGWGIEYLIQNKFMDCDNDDILEEIDRKVMERNPERITDWSLKTGLTGILHYVIARLHHHNHSFDTHYLTTLGQVAVLMLQNPKTTEGTRVAMDFLNYRESGNLSDNFLNLRELITLPDFEKDHPNSIFDLQTGQTGMALNCMV